MLKMLLIELCTLSLHNPLWYKMKLSFSRSDTGFGTFSFCLNGNLIYLVYSFFKELEDVISLVDPCFLHDILSLLDTYHQFELNLTKLVNFLAFWVSFFFFFAFKMIMVMGHVLIVNCFMKSLLKFTDEISIYGGLSMCRRM